MKHFIDAASYTSTLSMNRRTAELWLRQVAIRSLLDRCKPLLFLLAWMWRRLLFRTTFVAVTGSVGKTTTKEFLAEILALKGRTYRSLGTQNSGLAIPLNVLRVRPWHRVAVIEVGINKPGAMRPLARVVRPDVALILSLKRTHTTEFADLEQYAAEKAVLLEWIAPGGLAILNGDDPHVANMGKNLPCRIRLTGTSRDLDYWIDGISGDWPERLRFRFHAGEEASEIQTQQLGTHWASVLAVAIAAAHSLGISISDAARVSARTSPYAARLEPVALPNGAVLIRDDYNSSIDTLEASLRVLCDARAARRMLIITDFADSGMHRRKRLKHLASLVSEWLDVLIVCGETHDYGRRQAIAAGMPPENVHSFASLIETAAFLKKELRPGDLALLRGRSTDHVSRVFLAQVGSVGCWRDPCKKTMLCDGCWELGFQPDEPTGNPYPALPIFR